MKPHLDEVAALAVVVHSAFEKLGALGKKISPAATAALRLIERWLAGSVVSAEELQSVAKAAHEDDLPLAKREKDRALSWANTAAGNLAYVALKRRDWKDGVRTVMDAAVYTLEAAGKDGLQIRHEFEALRANALVNPTRPVAPVKQWKINPKSRPAAPEVAAVLFEFGYPAHDPVLQFEVSYGGFVFAQNEEPYWIFGAYDCLKSGAHKNPRGKSGLTGKAALVPVAYSPNDVIYYLDGYGVAWVHDTIEGELEKFADDGVRMMASITG